MSALLAMYSSRCYIDFFIIISAYLRVARFVVAGVPYYVGV